MNYLGHLYITRNTPELTYGNFIGDFVKGKKVELLPELDKQGVKLHRSIDFFTDQHLLTRKVKRYFSSEFGILSGILVDMYFDYILAKNWEDFNSFTLEEFSDIQLELLDQRVEDMPDMCAYMYGYFRKDNWLLRYETLEGTLKSLRGMTKQFNLKLDLEKSDTVFLEHEKEITTIFYEFIADIDMTLSQRKQ